MHTQPSLLQRSVIASALCGAFLMLGAPAASAATYSVCSSGCQFSTIQAAVDGSVDFPTTTGDTLEVRPGTYRELVTVDKRLEIRGPQAGVDARTRAGGGGGEAVLVPDPNGGTPVGFRPDRERRHRQRLPHRGQRRPGDRDRPGDRGLEDPLQRHQQQRERHPPQRARRARPPGPSSSSTAWMATTTATAAAVCPPIILTNKAPGRVRHRLGSRGLERRDLLQPLLGPPRQRHPDRRAGRARRPLRGHRRGGQQALRRLRHLLPQRAQPQHPQQRRAQARARPVQRHHARRRRERRHHQAEPPDRPGEEADSAHRCRLRPQGRRRAGLERQRRRRPTARSRRSATRSPTGAAASRSPAATAPTRASSRPSSTGSSATAAASTTPIPARPS